MPSKGLSVYSYISPNLPQNKYTVEFSVPGPNGTLVNTSADNFTVKSLELESSNLPGIGNWVGKFQWRVLQDGVQEVASAHNHINTFTGNLSLKHGGNMVATQHFAPFILDEVIITYGFYDAGHGDAGLTNRDQCYVTLCSSRNKDWQGLVAPVGSQYAELPFSRYVLPAPHDNGMNSMDNADKVLDGISPSEIPFLKACLPHLNFFSHLPDTALAHLLPNIVYGVSITQKKPISAMLDLGCRYFEFRPAELLPMFHSKATENALPPHKLYFQHACIPGLAFEEFLDSITQFLYAHPTEIIVIHIRDDNIVSGCRKPTSFECLQHINDACARNHPSSITDPSSNFDDSLPQLKPIGREAFLTPISTLRQSNTRIVFQFLAPKYDSWTASAYATLHADSILSRFESMNTEGQLSTDLTILQCQATSQSIKEVLVYSVLASNAATSCLTSTKAMGDMRTLPWIRDESAKRLRAERTVVVMNDFIDGATCDVCIAASRDRFELGPGALEGAGGEGIGDS